MDNRDSASTLRWWDSLDVQKMQVTVRWSDDDEYFPVHFEVCTTCEGKGRYVNPSIDSHGISREEMDENGPEFMEDYFSGMYDVICDHCRGDNVIPVPNEPRNQRAVEDYLNDIWESYAQEAAERRVGA